MIKGYEYAAKQMINFNDGYHTDVKVVSSGNKLYQRRPNEKNGGGGYEYVPYTIPIRNIEEIKKELGIDVEEKVKIHTYKKR